MIQLSIKSREWNKSY